MNNKLYYFVAGFGIGILVAYFIWGVARVGATVRHTQWSEWKYTECQPIGCGTSDGEQQRTRTCVTGGEGFACELGSEGYYDYKNGTCPKWYHWQNNGNWNQRCHRDFNWMHPEHVAPIGCPDGYEQGDFGCRKWIEPVPAETQTETIKCEAKIIECEPTITPTPTPTPKPEEPAPQPCNGCGGMPSAPACPDLSTILLPANFHVLRDGKIATLKWYQTQGDAVNIYYKEVSAKGWQYAVGDVKANTGSFPNNFNQYVVGSLNPNLGYTFGLQQKQGCGGGQLVTSVVVDGPQPRLFQFSYWTW